MIYRKTAWDDLPVTVTLSIFDAGNGAAECHAMIIPNEPYSHVALQCEHIEAAIARLQEIDIVKNMAPVFKRYFVSDAANMPENFDYISEPSVLGNENLKTAVSIVQQPPLNGAKVAVWIYFVENGRVYSDGHGSVVLDRPSSKHLYVTQLHKPLNDAYAETENIFRTCSERLRRHGCTLKDHCIRTWIYVQGVDIHYAKMVEARRIRFEEEGLNRSTYYIASTGIEGRHPDTSILVQMDAYAVKGLLPGQIGYLYAPEHLNPTDDYGVTFERGTTVDYGDRRHVFISGTASINNKGEIVHPLRIERQIERTMENIAALLSEAGTTVADVAQMIVYLRDMADYRLVADYFDAHHADVPRIIVWAPVCRPGWLIEVECIAVKAADNPGFDRF
jgi:enamine deaminase RidA (YjgF/YER057c/UK114 family)